MQTSPPNPPGDDEDEGGGGPVIIDPKRVSGPSVQAAIDALEHAVSWQTVSWQNNRMHPDREALNQIAYALRILRAVEGV